MNTHDGRAVSVVDECSLGTHTCDPNADCVDTPEGYTCRCKAGWQDASRDLRNPGRICKKDLFFSSWEGIQIV
ncbi:EGF-like domain protein [Necator americanus]|uniref:EGF-like domain protein n=1 Tax=Necator americanus TaxID=51031 RepID=W2SFK9_NECAM|nr:EGF-like domain protein [Necator americanus]ETN68365.1 EGF-like domain protein [Necator americanus]